MHLRASLTCIIFPLIFLSMVNGGRIMLISVCGTRSTMYNFQYLAEQLAEHGHEIVYVTGEKMVKVSPKNITYVIFPFKEDDSFQSELFDMATTYYLGYWHDYLAWLADQCKEYFKLKEMAKLINDSRGYDAVIYDLYVQDCFLPLAYSKNAPIIFIHGNVMDTVLTNQLAIPSPYSYVNALFYRSDANYFWNRLLNAFVHLQLKWIHMWTYYPKIEEIARRWLPNTPPITEIVKNASLVMGTLDNVWSEPRPSTPFVVDIAAIHCRPAKPIPKIMEDAIAEAGFILFALGSYFNPENLPAGHLDSLINAFAKLNQSIFWKIKNPPKNLPSNVKTFSWLPQQDLLGHPKIRLFISHGGLYSLYEAIYHAVPVLGIGLFADQMDNVLFGEKKGFVRHLDKFTITEATVYEGILSVLNNNSYKQNVDKLSTILKDTTETSLERALYWIDYVIKYKNLDFLHGPKELGFIQYFSLIELSILISACVIYLYISYLTCNALIRKLLNCVRK